MIARKLVELIEKNADELAKRVIKRRRSIPALKHSTTSPWVMRTRLSQARPN